MKRREYSGLATGISPSTTFWGEKLDLSVTELAERMKWIWLGIGCIGLVKHLNITARLVSESSIWNIVI